jgi:cytoskeletal protein RodZ
MFSTSNLLSRGLLVAGALALPLVSGAAFAQTATTTPAPAATSASTPSAPTANSSTIRTSTTASTDKQMGALKATPAEKRAEHDKKVVDKTAQKTAGTKAGAAMKKQAVDAKTAPAAQTAKPASGTPVTQ